MSFVPFISFFILSLTISIIHTDNFHFNCFNLYVNNLDICDILEEEERLKDTLRNESTKLTKEHGLM
jgi:hypothetical protein